MIARWMLAATVFGALVALSALALERLIRARARETRGLWSAALGVSVAWPLLAALLLTRPAVRAVVTMGESIAVGAPIVDRTSWWESLVWPSSAQVDAMLVGGWALASLLLAVQAIRAVRALRRVERSATPTMIAGERVLVSPHIGPAVFGLTAPRVVVPAWLLDFDASLQTMVLRHEREHCTGRDPWLVWLAVLSTTLMPWNVAVWFAASRLRLAMELDCDARTLRALPGRGDAYARLLLLIAQRGSAARFVPALAHTPSQLSRRIAAMTIRPVVSRAQRIAAFVISAGAVAAACSRPVAGNLAGPATPERQQVATAPVIESRATPTAIPPGTPYFDFQVERAATMLPGSLGPGYPEALRAARKEGSVLAQYVVGVTGQVDLNTLKVLRSDDPAFTETVKTALSSVRYAPAMVGGKPVKQLVQAPFAFSLGRDGFSTNVRVGMNADEQAKGARVNAQVIEETKKTGEFQEFTTDRQASLAPDFKGPSYPDALRAERIEGRVLVMIVVNADGTADLPSLKVLTSDHPLFTEAVKSTLANARFIPATVQGKAVRQLMQLPFEFKAPNE